MFLFFFKNEISTCMKKIFKNKKFIMIKFLWLTTRGVAFANKIFVIHKVFLLNIAECAISPGKIKNEKERGAFLGQGVLGRRIERVERKQPKITSAEGLGSFFLPEKRHFQGEIQFFITRTNFLQGYECCSSGAFYISFSLFKLLFTGKTLSLVMIEVFFCYN